MPPVTADVEDIRGAYVRGLEIFVRCPETRADVLRLSEELRGYIGILMPEATATAPRMRGEKREAVVRFLAHAREILAELEDAGVPTPEEAPLDGPPWMRDRDTAFELAALCRTAVSVITMPGPLGEATGLREIEDAIARVVCGACLKPIEAGEPTERKLFLSEAGPAVHGFVHALLCLPRRPLLVSVPAQPSPA